MCPDRQMISLFFDGELPSPWKEKMEAHLESCADCRSVLSSYKTLGEKFPIEGERIEQAQERVWKGLTAPELLVSRVQYKAKREQKGWNRSITLPLPAIAAVLVAVLFFALMALRAGIDPRPHDSPAMANIGLDDGGIVPMSDMNGVLRYLSSQDNDDFMVITLPESQNFSRSGEPTLVNAADYSRIKGFR